ncbi:SDR family NAD(P)-dependent oxidoreductase [Kitasatospora purpeofusca]|uniref:SDR family NAD(P)-dependent oxidoreductase n=1 Tax=Kitasatospora purpeofusca TaxID=67352 RepID=UPI002A5A7681|nr:SDR family NAD(P)-dependent oxidoreductase [Kitasatospora purpeofusca]MDY0811379.1 SDR family NAD(P)-dependent oxidoreductase [Kitasatospora purpeofusca]
MTRRPNRFEGRTALITGSSRGLGLLIAHRLAERGCRVLLCARDGDRLAAAEHELRAAGADAASLPCDLTDADAPQRLLTAVHEHFGRLDVLVNNAGVIQVGPLDTLREEDFRQAMETMLFAPLRLTLAALPDLRASAQGTLVNVSSIGGRVAAPHLLPYATAKFASTGLSEGLRAELAGTGVSVTTVLPGLMRTGSHTAARFHGRPGAEYAWFAAAASLPLLSMDAERASHAIVRAAERRRAEIVLTPAAKLAVRLHGVAPATTVRLLGLTARALPGPGPRPRHSVAGSEAAAESPLPTAVTALGDRAGRRFGEPRP